MARHKNPSNEFMNKIYKRIEKNLEGSGDVIFRHVMRTQNHQAGHFANQAMKRIEGRVREKKRNITTLSHKLHQKITSMNLIKKKEQRAFLKEIKEKNQ